MRMCVYQKQIKANAKKNAKKKRTSGNWEFIDHFEIYFEIANPKHSYNLCVLLHIF